MRIGIIFIAFIVLIFSNGCSRTVKYKTVDHYNIFDVDVPDYFKTLVIPKSNSQFQIGDRTEKFYLTIFMENISELTELGFDSDLNSYSRICLEGIKVMLGSPKVIEIDEFKYNDERKSYRITKFHEPTSDVLVYYISFFKGKTKFYSMVTWCLESDKSEHLETMTHIHSSFKEK